MTTITQQETEVRWDDVLDGTPAQVWDALTVHVSGWLWPITYEPRVGGSERGLTRDGGIVTAWEPERRFATRAERPDGWWNELEYRLDPAAGGGTRVRFVHRTILTPVELEMCEEHTDLYRQTLGAYVAHFAGRDARYESADAPQGVPVADVVRALGVPDDARVGDRVELAFGSAGVIDYRTPRFVGIRTEHALVRVFGRDAWGYPVGVARHGFDRDTLAVWLDGAVHA